MSTSYNNPAESGSPAVQAFLYQDTFAPHASPDIAPPSEAQAGTEKPAKPDNAPRISQEDISPLVAEAHAAGLQLGERQAAARFEA